MLCDVRVLAPAKINIGLRVMPARADGYHGIECIFRPYRFTISWPCRGLEILEVSVMLFVTV